MPSNDWPPDICRDLLGEADEADTWFLLEPFNRAAPLLLLVHEEDATAWIH